MCKTILIATFSASVALSIGAAGVAAATTVTPWYLVALVVGASVAGGLFLLIGLGCLAILASQHLGAIRISDVWRCTYWPKEQQLQTRVWFSDKLSATRYRTTCVVQMGPHTIGLDEATIGGTYFNEGQGEFMAGHSGPVMAEFSKQRILLEAPNRATVTVSIQPRNPWGKTKPESTEGGRRVSVLKRQEGAPVNLG